MCAQVLPKERRVAYVTALGEDPFSQRMRDFFAKAGIETDRIRTVAGRRPGLYAITLKNAERAFTYWRGELAARLLADDAAWLKRALAKAEMLYFSGITLAILAPAARRRLLRGLAARRKSGTGSPSTPITGRRSGRSESSRAKQSRQGIRVANIALPTFSDEPSCSATSRPTKRPRKCPRPASMSTSSRTAIKPVLVFGDGVTAVFRR